MLVRTLHSTTMLGINSASKECNTVWIGRRDNRLVVHITDGERVGQVPLNRDFIFFEITETVDRVPKSPMIVLTIVPCGMIENPVVYTSKHALRFFFPITTFPIEIKGLEFMNILRRSGRQNRLIHWLMEDGLTCVV